MECFFAASSDQGLFGGWIEAFVLSLTNVGAAFLIGQLVLPQLNRRGIFVKLGATAASLSCIGVLIAINLFGAHYRDYRAEAAKAEACGRAASVGRAEEEHRAYGAEARRR